MNNLLIWDAESTPPVDDCTTFLWRGFSTNASSNVISIPQLIENNDDALRSRYLAWVYELGELRLHGDCLVDHLQLRPSLSYWWMTLLVEKCNFSKSPQIDDAIRLLAFTDWTTGRSLERITLVSANQPLAECLRGWCEKRGVTFEWQCLPKPSVTMSCIRRAYTTLPAVMQAWAWLLKYLLDRWSLRGVGLNEWRLSSGRVTFFSYSDNCVPEAVQEGYYANRYWTHLPDVLKRESCQTNWLHLYVKDGLLPTARDAATALRAFNKTAQGQQCHVTLDTFISWSVIIKALKDWFRLIKLGASLSVELNQSHGDSLNLWPLFREEWHTSISGMNAISNLLFFCLFESALKNLPKQSQGVFLQENQGWEFGLVYAWKTSGHGQLIGMPHTTVRYWDLRYFFDKRTYSCGGKNTLPLPDIIACNGPVTKKSYLHGGYPVKNLVDVEALRYLHLGESELKSSSVPIKINEPPRLLVLGDYLPNNTSLQMKLLEQAVPLITRQLEIVVKPHPNCPIEPTNYPSLTIQVTMEPVSKLLKNCDVAYTSSATTSAVDAFCAGVPTISVLDPNTLNLSPLRGCSGALFASTPKELATALNAATATASSIRQSENKPAYFTINAKLPNWRKLLLKS
ncbi:MAG: hypothetical protein PHE17_07890 [Thiothrix sp.]|uniref:TIGR04326 family surface carbohydrate biosynthesis protein n=1 Tax=Thiothrix sp. TaxID=1032 RepID=UPI002616B172|nr:TIGR04326 family surface carbohydrate biosynthesis protein [Thiothrix sp.]MDD5392922.1 hypothetical protein [Thiothrix sp.]